MTTLSDIEFEAKYTTMPDPMYPEDSTWLRTPGEYKLDIPDNQLWTVVEGDDETALIVPGWHLVNRMGYLVTTEPWTDASEEFWWISPEDAAYIIAERAEEDE